MSYQRERRGRGAGIPLRVSVSPGQSASCPPKLHARRHEDAFVRNQSRLTAVNEIPSSGTKTDDAAARVGGGGHRAHDARGIVNAVIRTAGSESGINHGKFDSRRWMRHNVARLD